MAFVHGKDTEIWLDDADLSEYFNNAEFSAETDTADTSTFTNQWKKNVVGQSSATAELAGFYDPTQTDVQGTLNAGPNVLTIAPAGAAAVGDRARLFSVNSTAYKESSPVGDAVAFNWSVLADGQVGLGVVLHPLAAETVDGNGTTHDGLASSANGAIAHLHVTSVSSGDDITVSLEDSANGTDWTAISGGDFANLDAAGAERLAIAGTIRRYVRAVWDITGDGGESIEFAVAIARL